MKADKGKDLAISAQGVAPSGQTADPAGNQRFDQGKPELIERSPGRANLENYAQTYDSFDWEDAKREVEFFPNGKINAAYNAVDRHLLSDRKNKVALYMVSADNQLEKLTFQDIYKLSSKIGNALKSLGAGKGDRIFVFLPRTKELYASMIAITKIGAIAGPLFSAFGPDALRDRLADSQAKILITDSSRKIHVEPIRKQLPYLEYIIVVGEEQNLNEGELNYRSLIDKQSGELECEAMDPEDPLYLLYTSGTTGKSKGIVHVHGDIVGHHITTKWVLDLRDHDIYWCTADPGWVTGTVYGIFGPWSNGISCVSFTGKFDVNSWYSIIDRLKITVWYTAPTALRMFMKEGEAAASKHRLKSLRHICSVGEPLNPEVVRWGVRVYKLPIYDNWWQTETGMQLIANLPCLPIKPGSMGKPLPGVQAAIVDDNGNELAVEALGKLAFKPNWPTILRQVWRNEEKFKEYFRIPGWYFSGDNAWKDKDGYFWFVGRADDVINTSGHRVGPFEVESALVEHYAVAEAGVIGKPDEERGEIIKAFIVLANNIQPSNELLEEIKEFTKKQLAAHAYPREIEIRETLPKTRSGKIMRRLLKAQELGLPTGDISSLDDD